MDIRIADLTAWHAKRANQSRKMVYFVRVFHHCPASSPTPINTAKKKKQKGTTTGIGPR